MRLLSPVEVHAKGMITQIPTELSSHYFPVCLRAMLLRDGVSMSPLYDSCQRYNEQRNTLSHDRIESIMSNARDILGARCVSIQDPKSNTLYKIEGKSFDWLSFDFDKGHMANVEISQPVLLPIDHLLFEPQLAPWKISPEPGYLYIGCRATLHDQSSSYATFGSRYLDEHPSSHVIRSNKAAGKGTPQEDTGYPFDDEYVGEIGDVLHTTNSKIIFEEMMVTKSRWEPRNVFSKRYILQTPIEFPHGFVHETARALQRTPSFRAIAKKFSELISGEDKVEANAKGKKDKGFPLGEADLVGPDVAWKNSRDPWFVQTMLLARLFGGRFWKYSLGIVSARMGKEFC